MQNLIYAIEKLGSTPTCDYTTLGSQPANTLTVVTMGDPADTEILHLGIGVNGANGTVAVYLSKEGPDEPVQKSIGSSTTLLADVAALETQIDALANQWLNPTSTPI